MTSPSPTGLVGVLLILISQTFLGIVLMGNLSQLPLCLSWGPLPASPPPQAAGLLANPCTLRKKALDYNSLESQGPHY